ncbi:MAG: phenylalanine--tRNA ligase subunit alpha [Chloroflexi bacterium]|nr:phenylalanine--tRNA ligase subunit alpha [Chloroflexota bacterium]
MQTDLDRIHATALAALDGVGSTEQMEAWQRDWLGRRGVLTEALRGLVTLPAAERPAAGRLANEVKEALAAAAESRAATLRAAALTVTLAAEAVDVTLPGRSAPIGALHPVTAMIREICDVFALMGFQRVEGPEVELGLYNFDLLNIPKDHPARDVWDTFFIKGATEEIILRTHTSPMQARVMQATEPPVRVVVPGRCYRNEAIDASHEAMFFQIEGLAVDVGLTLSDLKGVLTEFARQIFGSERKTRFRCDFFPFVEPGVDFAIDCMLCGGAGCRLCKHTGWLEILGAGMVHPSVLEGVGYDPRRYTGFAFGMGVERITILKYGIDDIRHFFANDVRFLEQFARPRL